MGTIYEIICWTTGLRYIGQTVQCLRRRLNQHTSMLDCSSKFVIEHGNYEIYELEKVEDESLLREREIYYIQHTDCVNMLIGIDFDIKKYRDENRWKQQIPYKCECGKLTTVQHQARHRKSKFHQNFLAL